MTARPAESAQHHAGCVGTDEASGLRVEVELAGDGALRIRWLDAQGRPVPAGATTGVAEIDLASGRGGAVSLEWVPGTDALVGWHELRDAHREDARIEVALERAPPDGEPLTIVAEYRRTTLAARWVCGANSCGDVCGYQPGPCPRSGAKMVRRLVEEGSPAARVAPVPLPHEPAPIAGEGTFVVLPGAPGPSAGPPVEALLTRAPGGRPVPSRRQRPSGR